MMRRIGTALALAALVAGSCGGYEGLAAPASTASLGQAHAVSQGAKMTAGAVMLDVRDATATLTVSAKAKLFGNLHQMLGREALPKTAEAQRSLAMRMTKDVQQSLNEMYGRDVYAVAVTRTGDNAYTLDVKKGKMFEKESARTEAPELHYRLRDYSGQLTRYDKEQLAEAMDNEAARLAKRGIEIRDQEYVRALEGAAQDYLDASYGYDRYRVELTRLQSDTFRLDVNKGARAAEDGKYRNDWVEWRDYSGELTRAERYAIEDILARHAERTADEPEALQRDVQRYLDRSRGWRVFRARMRALDGDQWRLEIRRERETGDESPNPWPGSEIGRILWDVILGDKE
ncbi:MAG: hypothetical protein MR209_00470 [Veillonellaceae bacterium]|nr:hypothetical protein [Veillonellaceae bacterium]